MTTGVVTATSLVGILYGAYDWMVGATAVPVVADGSKCVRDGASAADRSDGVVVAPIVVRVAASLLALYALRTLVAAIRVEPPLRSSVPPLAVCSCWVISVAKYALA